MQNKIYDKNLDNTRINNFKKLLSPHDMKLCLPVSTELQDEIIEWRRQIRANLEGKDNRLIVIVGPCSIHDVEAGLEYARKLSALQKEVQDKMLIVMRVYFEKPRTTIGWKGLINDPHLDGSNDLEEGIVKARNFLLKVADLHLPTATEFLDPFVPQYTADLVSWAAIGARTTESQTHREMASGLSMPVGFKNATNGNFQIAIDAMISTGTPHTFLGIDEQGEASIIQTKGNSDVHVILRGGGEEPNYFSSDIDLVLEKIGNQGHPRSIMIDCSHGNSNKDYRRQPIVFNEVLKQFKEGQTFIVGVMLESFIHEGSQSFSDSCANLEYGISITDGCMDWETTETLIREGYKFLLPGLPGS
ncbi:MAG: 3-deoxy-7-phosphoheptulonate synthase [bacterium]|nr:3-deoxy-7-phosphoheptulonate synthase [bacterium]